MSNLRGRRVLVGVCGSIASYKLADVVRGLTKAGAEVRVVMSAEATHFVTPETLAALSGNPVITNIFDVPNRVVHVELGRWAEVFVIGGATASTLHRLATGDASDAISATSLMCLSTVVCAPAMHTEMWESSSVRRNVETLRSDGVVFVGPAVGDLASGDTGLGRLAEPADIVSAVGSALSEKDLAGRRILITAGATREAIDPVRFISNHSTGQMGAALAQAALHRGASVTVVAGHRTAAFPPGAEIVKIVTAKEMLDECLARFQDADVVIKVAAVADWTPVYPLNEKTPKSEAALNLELEPTTDIAAELGRKKSTQLLVVFAAQTSNLEAATREKLESKGADLAVGNLVGRPGTGFDSDTNEAVLVWPNGLETLGQIPKTELAHRILDRVSGMLAGLD